jgi:hypothetical protein
MIITSSEIHLASSRQFVEKNERQESLTMWDNGRPPTIVAGEDTTGREIDDLRSAAKQEAVKVNISPAARAVASTETAASEAEDGEMMDSAKLDILRLLVERLLHGKIRVVTPADLKSRETSADIEAAAESEAAPQDDRLGWGVIYNASETHYEAESTQFSAQGVIRTADGREIDFSVDLNMSREFMSHESITLRAGDALTDPLVINFDGLAAQLTETHFSFDLDLDGNQEQIAFVREGSGFLALDKNGDGLVNDGGELFGPATGDGFEELSAYDEDNNNWLDENDSVYQRLRIWTRDESGGDSLFALGSKGIGAIYLGSAATPFALKDVDNVLQGQIRTTGIYVKEDASVGTIQQLDMVA